MKTKYMHLNSALLHFWAKGLRAIKGSYQQKELLQCVKNNDHDNFVKHIETSIAKDEAKSPYQNQGDIPSLIDSSSNPIIAFTAGHMYLMPTKDIVALYSHWKNIPYTEAVCSSLWGAITLAEIKAKRIDPVWLAVPPSSLEQDAISQLDTALTINDPVKIDFLVRRVVRWLAGPGVFRGTAELYTNCSLAKAWWCGFFAYECAKILNKDQHEVTEALHTIWLALGDYLSGRLTVIAELNIVSALVLWVLEKKDNKRKDTEQIIRNLGEITTWCALGLESPDKIIEKFPNAFRI